MLSFAVSSKEGGGLRAKYTPVTNPQTGEPEMKDGLPVMMALPAAGYEKSIAKIFQSLFGVRLSDKQANSLSEKFWSFTGLLEVMNTLLDKEEKQRIVGSFLNKIFGKGAQGLYRNDPDRDIAEKSAAVDVMLKSLRVQPPEGMDIEQMKADYKASYRMTEEIVDEADDPTSTKPNYARQGIKHLYNRLPDGRVSSMEMSNAEFQEAAREIEKNGGTLNGMSVNLKVDGAGIRFGKDEQGRPFFMTSKVTTPLYADNVGYFTNFGIEKGQSQEFLSRTKKYDDALALITGSKFIQTLPSDTIVQAEMLYTPMAEKTDQGLKFVNISYDPKALGREMTLVPFMVKQYSTGEELPNADKIIDRLKSSSDKNIKIISNNLEQKGINVNKIIQPVLDIDPKSKENKPVFDQAKQELSAAIIDSPRLKGKDILGSNMEGIVVNLPNGQLFKVTSQQMKEKMSAKNSTQSFGDTKTRTAVVAIGNFAGHKGHEQLINFAIKKAEELGGTPFVFVGHKVGPDDPIDIKTKLETLKKLFPGVSVSVVENQLDPETGTETAGNIFKKIEYELIKKPPYYNNIVITVGSDQANVAKTAEQMQGRYSKFPPLAHVKVSAYVTPRGSDEGGTGVSTTQLRNALKTMPEDQAFQKWSQAYNVQKLGADWIRHLMDVARKHMGLTKPVAAQPQAQPVSEMRLFNALIRTHLPVTEGLEPMPQSVSGSNNEDNWDDEEFLEKRVYSRIAKSVFSKLYPNAKVVVQGDDDGDGSFNIETQDGEFGLIVATIKQEGQIVLFIENAWAGEYKGVTGQIVGLLLGAAKKTWGNPPEGIHLVPNDDKSEGYWQQLALKLGVKYSPNTIYGERPVNESNVDKKRKGQQGVAEGDDVEEGWKDKLAGLALAGSMALGSVGAHAQTAPDIEKPAAVQQIKGSDFQIVDGQRQINVDGKTYTWAGRGAKPAEDVKIIGKVIGVQGMIGIRGGNDVTLLLGSDGKYYSEGFGSITKVNYEELDEAALKNKIVQLAIKFYRPIMKDVEKEKVADYNEQAKKLLAKAGNPEIKDKLFDILKKGKENPYLQGGIITTIGALLASGVLHSGQNLGLSPSQTNLALQGILNTVIPTLVSRINGKNWVDTIKYTLASAGVGTGIASITENQAKGIPVNEDIEKIMSTLINRIIVNEAV